MPICIYVKIKYMPMYSNLTKYNFTEIFMLSNGHQVHIYCYCYYCPLGILYVTCLTDAKTAKLLLKPSLLFTHSKEIRYMVTCY